MLDIKLIRQQPQEIEKKLQTKDPSICLKHLLELDELLRTKLAHVEVLKSERNQLSKQIGGMKQKGEDCEELMEKVGSIGKEISIIDGEIHQIEADWKHAQGILPNLPMDDIKISPDPKDNVCVKEFLQKPEFAFTPKNHVELNEKLDLFDFKRSAKVSGAGWPAYKGFGARLEWALLNYMIDTHIKNGYTFWLPPLLVKDEMLQGSGQLPKFDKQLFKLDDEDYKLRLIPTSEVVLNGLHTDEIFEADQLPLRYTSYTPCFRREAGAAGSAERGLIRMHQFNKVEMFCFTHPEKSMEIFDEMVAAAESILQGLGIHYRNMLLVTGDMSFAATRTVDIEAWLPGQNRYYEVSSVSNCSDFQARRSAIRFREKGGKPEFVHTLNGSGLATSRLMVALLENNQQEDGSVIIPKVLSPYLGGVDRIFPVG